MRREIRLEREPTESRTVAADRERVSVIYDGAVKGVVLL
jgi:hypothetical protein